MNPMLTPREMKPGYRWQKIYLIALVFLGLNVMVLYILQFTHGHEEAETTVSMPAIALSVESDGQMEVPVSFMENGVLGIGAGISVYLNRSQGISETMSHLALQATATTKLMAFTRTNQDKTKDAVIAMFEVNEQFDMKISSIESSNVISGTEAKDLVMLSDSHGVLLTITYATSNSPNYLVPVHVSNGEVRLLPQQQIQVAERSAATFMNRLSDTSTVILFYDYMSFDVDSWASPRQQKAVVSTMDTNGNQVLSDVVTFGETSNSTMTTEFGPPIALPGVNGGFAVFWYQHSANGDYFSGLCVEVMQFDGSKTTVIQQICDRTHQPHYLLDSIALNDFSIALAFYDQFNHYALTLLTIEFARHDQKVHFRNAVVVEAGGSFDFGPGYPWFPTPKLTLLASSRLAIAYLHAGRQGNPSLKLYDLQHHELTPIADSILFPETYSIVAPEGSFSAAFFDLIPLSSHTLLMGYMHSISQVKRFAVIDLRSSPFGLVRGKNQITHQGTFTFSSKSLQPGKIYYATTKGKVVAGGNMTVPRGFIFINDELMVSSNSQLGIAVNEKELYLFN